MRPRLRSERVVHPGGDLQAPPSQASRPVLSVGTAACPSSCERSARSVFTEAFESSVSSGHVRPADQNAGPCEVHRPCELQAP